MLLCLADLIEGASVTTDVEWIGADGTLITDGGGISIGDLMMEGVGVSRNLTFDSLLASQAGEYTCRASFPEPDSPAHDIASNLTTIVTVQSKLTQNTFPTTALFLYYLLYILSLQFPLHLYLSQSHLKQSMKELLLD